MNRPRRRIKRKRTSGAARNRQNVHKQKCDICLSDRRCNRKSRVPIGLPGGASVIIIVCGRCFSDGKARPHVLQQAAQKKRGKK